MLAFNLQLRECDAAIAPSAFLSASQGIEPRHDSATGFPVRSHHLSGLRKRTAVKGEPLHHFVYYNSRATIVSTRSRQSTKRSSETARPLPPDMSGPIRPAR